MEVRPDLSTVILSWNRKRLLEKTINTYLETITVDYELYIVDNGSRDGSQRLIASACNKENHHSIFLEENVGGEALNLGLSHAKGRYLHISENDVAYTPGWDRELIRKLSIFPEIGQLCLYSPHPEANRGEIWEDHPAKTLTREDATVYVADGNVSTTSIIRREIWDAGIRWHTLGEGEFRFPDDGRFSAEVKSLGYLVAWNDRYVASNRGHNVDEFKRDLQYYVNNYRSKPWLGVEGFVKRLHAHGYDLVANSRGEYELRHC